MNAKGGAAIAAITGVVAASYAAVGRLPSVPFDDSWVYLLPLRQFLETGVPRFHSFASAAAVLHIVLAAPAALIFGVSAKLGAAHNMVVTCLAALALYGLLRETGAARPLAVFGSLAFFATPPVFLGAYTFHSDPIFVLLMVVATWLFVAHLRRGHLSALAAASFVAAATVWVRMHGVFIAAAFAAFVLLRPYWRKRFELVAWLWMMAPTAVSFALFRWAKFIVHPYPITLDRKMGEFVERLWSPGLWATEGVFRLAVSATVVALFLLPLVASAAPAGPAGLAGEKRRSMRPWHWLAALGVPVFAYAFGTLLAGRDGYVVPSVLTEPPPLLRQDQYRWIYAGAIAALPLWVMLFRERFRGRGWKDRSTDSWRWDCLCFFRSGFCSCRSSFLWTAISWCCCRALRS
ncbi:MAG: hypothetical protein M5R36_22590 [Deltaproteobacteria bacterium]|nr:hypothetical protein [Deltaproteobacteria bacterium]